MHETAVMDGADDNSFISSTHENGPDDFSDAMVEHGRETNDWPDRSLATMQT